MTAVLLDTDRRRLLRALAEDIDDFPAPMVATMLRRWADFTLTPADREQAWGRLTAAVALLAALRCGAVEPRVIVPGAPANQAATIAGEVLEEDVDAALDILTGGRRWPESDDPCPECPTGRQVVGRMEPDTGHVPASCDAGCGWTA